MIRTERQPAARRRARSLADALSPYRAVRVPDGRTTRRRIAALRWLALGSKARSR